MAISAWSVIKNESQFIGYGLMSILPYVDEVVYFDGNSTDGTLALLHHIKDKYDPFGKIRVYHDKDFKDFKGDYTRVFNECMKECRSDYLWYVHPDMILTDQGTLPDRARWRSFAYYVNMRSFAGEDMDKEITVGRTTKWKTIMRNAFGVHYWGDYGNQHEDMYFRAITGAEHYVYGDMRDYPYVVGDSGIKLWHMCECKPQKRREEKMAAVLTTAGAPAEKVGKAVASHPRVTLETSKSEWGAFEFTPRTEPLPEVFAKYQAEFEPFRQ